MANRAGKITHKRTFVLGETPAASGLSDRAALRCQIAEILEGLSSHPGLAPRIQQSLEAFLHAVHTGDTDGAAKHVSVLLNLELDDLRKAALLSLMVRLTGKRKFDPIAAYILQNQTVFVTM
jgi:hypothetical protein